ncbi:MAG: hypothetical protein ACRC5H_05145 [Treponemataceae bacterium]
MGMIQKNLFAFPNALGMLLLTSSMIISHKYNYSYRSLIISGILSILAFYTKPYYMVGIGYICTWLFFFSSYKKSLKVFFYFSIAFSFSLIIAHLFFPSYTNNNLFHHTGVASYQVNHMINQVLYFFNSEFILLFLYVIFFTTVSLKEKFNLTVQFKFKTVYNIAVILSFIFFLFKLGGHGGSGSGAYLYDMMYPFLFLAIGIQSKITLLSKFKILCLVIALSTVGFTYNYKLKKKLNLYQNTRKALHKLKVSLKKALLFLIQLIRQALLCLMDSLLMIQGKVTII